LSKPGAIALGIRAALSLSAKNNMDVIHFLSGTVDLTDSKKSVVTIARTGHFTDPRYGDFNLTLADFTQMIRNFERGVYGQKIFYDVAHKPEHGNAGEITRLFLQGDRLRGEVVWTNYGREAIRERGFIYSSAEIHPNYQSNEYNENGERQSFGVTLLGAGLVTRPCLKHLDEIQLSQPEPNQQSANIPVFICSELLADLAPSPPVHKQNPKHPALSLNQAQTRLPANLEEVELDNFIKSLQQQLKQKLAALHLNSEQASTFIQLAEQSLTNQPNQQAAENLIAQIESAAQTLKASGSDQPVTLSVQQSGLDEAGVKALIEQVQRQQAEDQQRNQDSQAEKIKYFTDAINGAEGLSDTVKTQLIEANSEFIGAAMTKEQILKFAETQIAQGQQMASNQQLLQLGFDSSLHSMQPDTTQGLLTGGMNGVWQGMSNNDSNGSGKLQEFIHTGLRNTNAFSNGQLHLLAEDKLPAFCRKVLGAFDQINAPTLRQEAMQLSGQANTMTNVNLPVGVQREVIREALSDLRVLELVQTRTDLNAQAVTQIPYEVRNVSGIPNDGIVYENQRIHKVGVTQKMDLGYVLPMKIAFELSNELMHFSRISTINWEAWGRNVSSAAHAIRELITRRIVNEMQRYADSFNAMNVVNEDVNPQLATGAAHIKLANFPLVRPFQQFDLQGNPVGLAEHPITLTINGNVIAPFSPETEQVPGLYYLVANYNLGYVFIVDESGEIQTDLASSTATMSYSAATNIVKVNADVPPGSNEEKHLNTLLKAIGRRKAIMSDDRYVVPDFMLSSNTLNDTMTNAESFVRDSKRNGTDTNSRGDLDRVKSIPAHTTNVAGHHLGDERILMGQRGQMSYTIAKPYALSEMQESRDEKGNLTGGKEAYGEEYNCVYCPKALRDRFTSVLYFSASERASA